MPKHPQGDSAEKYSEEETVERAEAMLKRMLSTPPKHKAAKGEKANPPKKRGRPMKDKPPSSDEGVAM